MGAKNAGDALRVLDVALQLVAPSLLFTGVFTALLATLGAAIVAKIAAAMVGRFTDSSRRRRLAGTLAARPAPWAPAPALASVTSAPRNGRTAAPAAARRANLR